MTQSSNSRKSAPDVRRPDLRRTFERDARRYQSRETGNRSFLRSLAVIGSIGWPIAALSVGGAWLGRWLDQQWNTGVRMTMVLVFVGATLGGAVAWSVMQGTHKR